VSSYYAFHKAFNAARLAAVLMFLISALGTRATAATSDRRLQYAFALYPASSVTAHEGAKLSGPGSGTLVVEFVAPEPTGGTLIRATEWWWNEPRAEQPITCELGPGSDLNCSQYPLPSMVEVVLFPLLSSDYFSGISASKWQRQYTVTPPTNYYRLSTTVDLNVLRWTGSVAEIESKGVTRPIDGPLVRQFEDGTVKYDRARSLPVAVHEEWTRSLLDDVDSPVTVDLALKP
jgi:hypothetical protein